MPKSQSSGNRLSGDFDKLAQFLSRQGLTVDEIAEHQEIKALFYKFKNPKRIALDSLKARIRLAIQRDRDRDTGQRNQVSIPGILDEPQHYEVADDVSDNQKMLYALDATCKVVRGHITNNKFFLPEEVAPIMQGIATAEKLFRLRLA